MNVEEYRAIRNEMLQRFQSTNKLIFFAIISIGALFAWLGTNPEGDPYVFICIGLVILLYLFHTYLRTLQGIYNAGSYLVLFHEDVKDENGFKYHILSRFINRINNEEFKWGYDGVKGALILILLAVGVFVVPLYFMHPNINFLDHPVKFVVLVIDIGLSVIILYYVIIPLFRLGAFMEENMSQWIILKEKLEKDKEIIPNLLDEINKKHVQAETQEESQEIKK